jgi:hypothetical protein
MRRLCGETLEEISTVARRWPEATTINWPPRGSDAYRSKSLPLLFVDADRQDILDELESVPVPEEYITVLTMMTRERFFNEKCGGPTEASSKFFAIEIRGKVIQLLRAGAWIDDPSSLSLKNLNNKIENCDLGRRSDLKFSSNPIPLDRVQKYDQDLRHAKDDGRADDSNLDEEATPDFESMYRDGSTEQREEILRSRPWMRSMLAEKYGPPDQEV